MATNGNRTVDTRWIFGVLVALGLFVCWRSWLYAFLCDDGYITFRYARNLVDGHGMVFNPGEYVEGATETLWTLVLAFVWKVFGWRPESSALWIGGAYTAGVWATFCALAWRLFVDPARVDRGRVALGEAALVVSAGLMLAGNRSLAVWATSGLAHRQHTLLMLGAIALVWSLPASIGALVGASLLLALAELARPETLLFAPAVMAGWFLAAPRSRRFVEVLALGLPYHLCLIGHLLLRKAYYGEWLPNTYYAKNVAPWWDMGAVYLGLAGIEHALWLLLPLALLGTLHRSRAGDHRLWTMWLIFVPFSLQLAKGGGDHFEFRMLDLLWPLAAIGAAAGLSALSSPAARFGLGAFAAWQVLAPGVIIEQVATRTGRPTAGIQYAESPAPLAENAPAWAWLSVPFPLMWSWYDTQGHQAGFHRVATRWQVHREFALKVLKLYGKCEAPDGKRRFPEEFIAPVGNIGVVGFYLHDMQVLDTFGLTDHTIARTPVVVKPDKRILAHERAAPIGYLQERGVWIMQGFGITGAHNPEIPSGAACVPACGGQLCMGVENPDAFKQAFARYVVYYDEALLPDTSATTSFETEGEIWAVRRTLADFEGRRPVTDWVVEGEAFRLFPAYGRPFGQTIIVNMQGAGLINTFKNRLGDAGIGSARSPEFTPEPGDALAFLVGGGLAPELAVELKTKDGTKVAEWRGQNSSTLRRVVFPLDPWVGQSLFLVVRDGATGGWGHLLVDDIVLARRQGPAPKLDLEADWVDNFDDRRSARLWAAEGEAVRDQPLPGPTPGQVPIAGLSGGLVNTYVRRGQDFATGRMQTPARVVWRGDQLRFRVGGGSSEKLGVFLLDGDEVLASWRGENKEELRSVEVDLSQWAGRTVLVRIEDQEQGAWGHLLVDDFAWTRGPTPTLDLEGDWVDDFDRERTARLWSQEGNAAAEQPVPGAIPGQSPIAGIAGGLVNTYVIRGLDGATGRMQTPPRRVLPGDRLRFRVGGGDSEKLGVFLVEGDTVLASWRGERSEALRPVEVDLSEWAGRNVLVRFEDQEQGAWGHLLVDDFLWTRGAEQDRAAP